VLFTPPNNLSAVSLTLAKNFRLFGYLPVTRIKEKFIAGVDKFFAGVVDTAEQFIAGVLIQKYYLQYVENMNSLTFLDK
jgi:hypothetical protein